MTGKEGWYSLCFVMGMQMNINRTPRRIVASGALLFATALAGCSTSNSPPRPDVQLSAYAASTNYPNTQPQMAKDVGVILSTNTKVLRVLNFSQSAINDSEIWLNGTYVFKVDTIAGDGYVKLSEGD